MGVMDASLATLASSVPGVIEYDDVTVRVGDVTHDSRHAGPGVIFVAIQGAYFDGHLFLDDVVSAGSPAAMVARRSDAAIPQLVVRDPRAAMAHLAREVHGRPDLAMKTIGLTGTNGKTTVAAMCEAILTSAGQSVGVLGTLGARIGGAPEPLERTTPESSDLFRLLAVMRDSGVDSVVMEVSSHAMALHRVDAMYFDVVAFTNLSRDHLDFHGDMETYYREKRRLFERSRAKSAVVNVSDPTGIRLFSEIDMEAVTVALDSDADYVAHIVDQGVGFTRFDVADTTGTISLDVPLPGSFNVENAVVAFAICKLLGIRPDDVATGLATMPPLRGRMQRVDPRCDFEVVVDFAHTPIAIEAVALAAREMTRGRVIVVVGAGGDRDVDKRPLMGASAGSNSDILIVTTDNPRSEDPAAIASAVYEGAVTAGASNVQVVLDRRAAIAKAIDMAGKGDLVLILGKGHEQGQEIEGVKHPFDDVQVAVEVLSERGGSS